MTFNTIFTSPLWRNTAVRILAVLAVILLCVALGLYWHAQMAASQLVNAQNELSGARSTLEQTRSEEQIIARHLQPYYQLQKYGFVGQPQRIKIVDALARLREQRPDLDFKYTFTNTQLSDAPSSPSVQLSRLRIKLELAGLHELDAFNIIQQITQAQAGIGRVDSCVLTKRLNADGQLNRVLANCDLDWFTATQPSNTTPASQ